MHGPGLEPDWGKTIVDDILGATEEIWIWTGYRVISRNHTVNFVQYDVIFFFWMLFFFKSLLFRDKPKCFGSRIVCICNFKYFNTVNISTKFLALLFIPRYSIIQNNLILWSLTFYSCSVKFLKGCFLHFKCQSWISTERKIKTQIVITVFNTMLLIFCRKFFFPPFIQKP